MELLTLLHPEAAKEGAVWTYLGEPEECSDCDRKKLCHGSLCTGASFQVVTRKGAKSYCKLREEEVESVQIRKPDSSIALDARVAKEGAIIEFARTSCGMWICPYRELCDPLSVADGDRVKISRVERTFPCAIDSNRTLCVVRTTPL